MTLIQYLEELTDAERVITVPADEVERLVHRFGDRVRAMGRWNTGSDGSLQIPESVIRQAAMQFQNHVLVEAVGELKLSASVKFFSLPLLLLLLRQLPMPTACTSVI